MCAGLGELANLTIHRASQLRLSQFSQGNPHALAEIDTWKFESFRPSHTVLLFWPVGRLCGKVPTFRALARDHSVSGAQ